MIRTESRKGPTLRRIIVAMKEAPADDRFERGLYSVSRAAQLVGMQPSTLRAWATGYSYERGGRKRQQGAIITALATTGDDRTVPFIGLVEATVVQAFRRTGLSMQRIRTALSILAAQGELEHALASRQLYSDGANVLFDYAKAADDRQLGLLTVVQTGQRVFHDVIRDYLERITYSDDRWPSSLVLPVTDRELLRVRPAIAGGDPLFIHGGAPLSAVRARFVAGEPIASIAKDFDVPVDDIEEALHAVWPQAA